ncbi:MBG domain-containing protein [Flammeovirga agarivorans]|uniref:T9SS type A sorting domain-containing protein n=1 Tax=Flammeovirga agarivorans TaxID=2726742 RepID=A0A7X8SPE3_9BACT|nr:MBG domain-containing protein [Flammeovirga agarivorans]NLR93958.1 T9SS type A sorting domain-containing protein [Flammeovirga agarivorans]
MKNILLLFLFILGGQLAQAQLGYPVQTASSDDNATNFSASQAVDGSNNTYWNAIDSKTITLELDKPMPIDAYSIQYRNTKVNSTHGPSGYEESYLSKNGQEYKEPLVYTAKVLEGPIEEVNFSAGDRSSRLVFDLDELDIPMINSTLSMWVKMDDSDGKGRLIFTVITNDNRRFGLTKNTASHTAGLAGEGFNAELDLGDDGVISSDGVYQITGGQFLADTYHHVVIVNNAKNSKAENILYIDGVQYNATNSSNTSSMHAAERFSQLILGYDGRLSNGNGDKINTNVTFDKVQIFNTALDINQVANLYRTETSTLLDGEEAFVDVPLFENNFNDLPTTSQWVLKGSTNGVDYTDIETISTTDEVRETQNYSNAITENFYQYYQLVFDHTAEVAEIELSTKTSFEEKFANVVLDQTDGEGEFNQQNFGSSLRQYKWSYKNLLGSGTSTDSDNTINGNTARFKDDGFIEIALVDGLSKVAFLYKNSSFGTGTVQVMVNGEQVGTVTGTAEVQETSFNLDTPVEGNAILRFQGTNQLLLDNIAIHANPVEGGVVEPNAISITSEDTFTFDGNPVSITTSTTPVDAAVTLAFFDKDDTPLAEAPTNPGTYKVVASLTDDAEVKAEQTFTVNAVAVTFEMSTLIFDINTTPNFKTFITPSPAVEFTVNTEAVDMAVPTDYTITATSNQTGYEGTQDFIITVSGDIPVDINLVSGEEITYTYTGSNEVNAALFNLSEDVTFDLTFEDGEPILPGDYSVKVTVTADGYEGTKTFDVTVEGIESSVVLADNEVVDFTGEDQFPSVTLGDGITEEDLEWSATPNAATVYNALTATIKKVGYKEIVSNAVTFTINSVETPDPDTDEPIVKEVTTYASSDFEEEFGPENVGDNDDASYWKAVKNTTLDLTLDEGTVVDNFQLKYNTNEFISTVGPNAYADSYYKDATLFDQEFTRVEGVNGEENGALSFVTNDRRITIDLEDLDQSVQNSTFSTWIQTDNSIASSRVLLTLEGSNDLMFGISSNNQNDDGTPAYGIGLAGDIAGGIFQKVDYAFEANTFHHVVVSIAKRSETNSSITIYVDGVQTNNVKGGNPTLTGDINYKKLYLGYDGRVSSNSQKNSIPSVVDNFEIYEGVLSPEEVKYLYNQKSATPLEGAVAPDASTLILSNEFDNKKESLSWTLKGSADGEVYEELGMYSIDNVEGEALQVFNGKIDNPRGYMHYQFDFDQKLELNELALLIENEVENPLMPAFITFEETEEFDFNNTAIEVTYEVYPNDLTVDLSYEDLEGNDLGAAPTNPGTYKVIATVNSTEYEGAYEKTITINPVTVDFTISETTFKTNSVVDFEALISSDPEVNFDVNTSAIDLATAGSYDIIVTANQVGYNGSKTFEITLTELEPVNITISQPISYDYTGNIEVTKDLFTLSKDVDFSLTYSADPILPGIYSVTAEVITSGYSGKATFEVEVKTIKVNSFTADAEMYYTGEIVYPTVYTDGKDLNIDFKIVGDIDPIRLGAYTVVATIDEVGYEEISKEFNYEIVPIQVDITLADKVVEYNFGEEVLPTVITGDYELEYTYEFNTGDGSSLGEHKVYIEINQEGYEGSALLTYEIEKINLIITLSNLEHVFDQGAKEVYYDIEIADSTYYFEDILITYNDSTDLPIEVGEYIVKLSIDDPYYQGTVTDTLIIHSEGTIINDIHDNLEDQLTVYPVPSNGNFTLETNFNSGILKVYSLTGEVIKTKLFDSQKIKMDLGTVAKGVYIIDITDGNRRITKKHIIK